MSVHADWMNLLYLQRLQSSQIGETTPQHQQLPHSSGKTEKHRQPWWPEHTTKIFYFACANQTNLSFIANISNGDTGQLEDQNTNHGSMIHDAILMILGFCTHHAHTCSCEPGFGFIILVHQQLSTGVTNNQLIQLQQRQTVHCDWAFVGFKVYKGQYERKKKLNLASISSPSRYLRLRDRWHEETEFQ